MNLQNLLDENPSINITVSGKDLQEYGHAIAKQTAEAILLSKGEKILTAAEVEGMFNNCPATRWRWSKLGILKERRVGNRVYYPESEVKELLQTKRTTK